MKGPFTPLHVNVYYYNQDLSLEEIVKMTDEQLKEKLQQGKEQKENSMENLEEEEEGEEEKQEEIEITVIGGKRRKLSGGKIDKRTFSSPLQTSLYL